MTQFPEAPQDDDYAAVYLEETDKPLPERINPATRYMYVKTIAKGGKCVISSCRDVIFNRTICHKKLLPEFQADAIEQRRFLREARVSAMLQHPSIVPTYDLGRDRQGHLYFTMKLVHGYTLREVLDYRERYDLTQLTEVIIQVANALAYAHSHRVVHRDIKPENILVGRFGEVLLVDWGLAKVWSREGTEDELDPNAAAASNASERPDNITGQAKLQGTAAYMSPEQIQRDPQIGYRTDIYSLGAVLYEVLTGRTPFLAETVREMTEQIVGAAPPDPSSVTNIRVPDLLAKLTMACLSNDPAGRPNNCTEVVRLLHEW